MLGLVAVFCVGVVLADPTLTIVGNAAATPDLSTLVTVLTSPGYEPIYNALNSPGTYTVFAPNNAAFAAAGVDPSQVDFVSQVLYYHTLGAVVKSTDLKELQFPGTLMNNQTYVNIGKDASGKFLSQVLDVTATSSGVFINWGIPGVGSTTAQVVTADVICSNGVVHIINKVILFPALVSVTAVSAGLTTLVNAVVAANLTGAVDNTASLTIFAPTNAAFDAVGGISQFTQAQLQTILEYHVVPAVAYSTSLTNGEQVPTLLGPKLTISVSSAGVSVKGASNVANVVVANALTQNGVVHVIDAVLLPPTFNY